MTEAVATDEFTAWYVGLEEGHGDCVLRAVTQLEEKGVALPFPLQSSIVGAEFALRELRIKCQGHQLRVFYTFDPRREAVLIIGGDKTGDDRFYERMIPLCEAIWKQYKKEQGF